jgi:rubrerythrin
MATSEIKQNIFQAYEGESKASVRLRVYAEQAVAEGLSGAASLFNAIAASAGVHARNNIRLLGTSRDTLSNLSYSVETGTAAAKAMYAKMEEMAGSEGNAHAAEVFGWMLAAENRHAELYREVIEEPPPGRAMELHVCDTCGLILESPLPDRCPICGRETRFFLDPS